MLLALGLGALSVLAPSGPARACSCAEAPEPEQAAENADVVFEGRPTQVEALQANLGFADYYGALRFRFEVARYYKGQLGPQLSVFTVDQSSACGRAYDLDEPHIIYARYTEDGLLTDFLCSRSLPLARADADRAALGAGVAPDPGVGDETGVELASDVGRNPVSSEAPIGCASSLVGARSAARWPAWVALLGMGAWRAGIRRRRHG